MCFFKGDTNNCDNELIKLDPKDIPCECKLIIYGSFSIDESSVIDVDEGKYIFFISYRYLHDITIDIGN